MSTNSERILPGTWLDALTSTIRLVDPESRGVIPSTVPLQGGEAIIIGLDHGNDAFKIALRHATEPRMIVRRVIASYASAKEIRSGEGYRTWNVDGSESFWMGTDALHEGSPLPVGSTFDRIADSRQSRFMGAVLTQALIEAGYKPGAYRLVLGFGVPVEELGTGGIIQETREAIKVLQEHQFSVELRDPQWGLSSWNLSFSLIVPIPQSFGAFLAWSRNLAGQSVTNGIDAVSVLDFGGGHTQKLDIALKPKMNATGGLLGEGTVALARQLQTILKQQYRGLTLSLAEVQHALIHRQVVWGGEYVDISAHVETVLQSQGHNTISQTLQAWQDQRKFVICTGGGAILLADLLRERAEAVGRSPRSYLIMPQEWASTINSVGLFIHGMLVAYQKAQSESR